MPEAKRKERKQEYELQAESHLNGLRVATTRPKKPLEPGNVATGGKSLDKIGQPDQPALISKLIDFIKDM